MAIKSIFKKDIYRHIDGVIKAEDNDVLKNELEEFVITDIPLVLFFPGEYVQTPGSGASLHLFGRKEGRGYYRAFDVETFLKMNNSVHAAI